MNINIVYIALHEAGHVVGFYDILLQKPQESEGSYEVLFYEPCQANFVFFEL
jgi:hypothetical protein